MRSGAATGNPLDAGRWAALPPNPFGELKEHHPFISPLRYGEDAADVMLAQTTAETLAGLVLVNLFAPN